MRPILAALMLSVATVGSLAVTSDAQAKTIDSKVWADMPEVLDVSLSPDGERIALLQRPKRGGDYQVATYETSNPGPTLRKLDTGRLKPANTFWANKDVLIVTLIEQATDKGDTVQARRVLAYNTVTEEGVVLLDGKSVSQRSGAAKSRTAALGIGGLVSRLDLDPDHVLMFYQEDQNSPDYYKVNVRTGERSLVGKGNSRYGSYSFDDDGEIRAGQTYEPDGPRIVSLARVKGSEDWVVVGEQDARKRQRYNLFGFYDPSRPNIGLASMDMPGENFSKIVEFDVTQPDAAPTVIYEKAGYDAGFPVTSPRQKDGQAIVGFTYHGTERVEYEYTDPFLAQTFAQIEQAFPGQNVTIDRVADDDSVVLFNVSGPTNPGEWYMIKNGQASKVATARPDIPSDALSPERTVMVTARDGRVFPAYVTIPRGADKPLPGILMPHGGPWVREYSGFNEWSQMLSNQGYVVVRPQYRGSTNLGLDHWVAGDRQWGFKMQDDMEDAMLQLVEEGVIDRKRMAVWGWSYGGYATKVAATRNNGLFNCAVAGAGVSNITQLAGGLNGSRFLRRYQKPTIEGYSPIEYAEDVSIPMLIIHGNLDSTVDVRQSRRFVKALKSADKDVDYIEVKGMRHNPAFMKKYSDYMEFYPDLKKFLKTECDF